MDVFDRTNTHHESAFLFSSVRETPDISDSYPFDPYLITWSFPTSEKLASMPRTDTLHITVQRSALSGNDRARVAYGPYGAQSRCTGLLLGFAGQKRDCQAAGYHLGNGHRMYKPVLMRFASSDRLSPFGKGGINAYAYCLNDPINRHDPSGRIPAWLSPIRNLIGGVLNLGISFVKAYRGFVQSQDFDLNTGYAGTRGGVVPSIASENSVSRWRTRDTVLTTIGATTAAVSIGTSMARLVTADSAALMWTDFAFGALATVMSGHELYTIATSPVDRRYNVQLHRVNVRETSV